MWRIKRGKRPKLRERGFEVNRWNEYEKRIDNVVMKVNSRRGIDVYRKDERAIFVINDIKEEIEKFGIIDLAEEF